MLLASDMDLVYSWDSPKDHVYVNYEKFPRLLPVSFYMGLFKTYEASKINNFKVEKKNLRSMASNAM